MANRSKYKVYPVIGSVLMMVAVVLIESTGTGLTTAYWRTAVGMALLGAGIGLATTVYVLAVQKSVPYRDMGAAIATASFARAIFGAVGVAIFGEIFANPLAGQLKRTGLAGIRADALHLTPAELLRLRGTQTVVYERFIRAFSHALHSVFLASIPVGILALVLALGLKEIPLRRTAGEAEANLEPGHSVPTSDAAG